MSVRERLRGTDRRLAALAEVLVVNVDLNPDLRARRETRSARGERRDGGEERATHDAVAGREGLGGGAEVVEVAADVDARRLVVERLEVNCATEESRQRSAARRGRRERAGRTAEALGCPAVAAREVRLPGLVLRLGDGLHVHVTPVAEDGRRGERDARPRDGVGRAAVRATLRDVGRVRTRTARGLRARGGCRAREGGRERRERTHRVRVADLGRRRARGGRRRRARSRLRAAARARARGSCARSRAGARHTLLRAPKGRKSQRGSIERSERARCSRG